jgi:hypothetical protein
VLRGAATGPSAPEPVPVAATVVRPARIAAAPVDATQVRPRGAAPAASDTGTGTRAAAPKRSRAGTIIAVAAGFVVVAAIGIAVALSGTLQQAPSDPTAGPSDQDAILAATVPAPVVEDGVRSADGVSVSFPVSHPSAEDGDRYRWHRADGSGSTEVAEGPSIVVAGVGSGERVCIEVQVQRGSKTSEPVTGCTP